MIKISVEFPLFYFFVHAFLILFNSLHLEYLPKKTADLVTFTEEVLNVQCNYFS